MTTRRSPLGAIFLSLALLGPVLTATRTLAQTDASDSSYTGDTAQATKGLDLRFADGIVAIADDKIITVDDVRREISPLIPQIQRDSQNEQQFNEKLEGLENDVIQNLIDRVLIINDFNKDDKRHVPDSFVDNRIDEILIDQFDGDRSKFLAYLRGRGKTMKDFRQEVLDDIIYGYMRQQQTKSANIVSPVRVETFYKENKSRFYQEDAVKLRLIQLTRQSGETDDQLRARAEDILAKFKAGANFGELAKQYSQDARASQGGDWGWQKRSDLKAEFSNVIFDLKKGECSAPVITSDGAFLLYVEDRKYAGIQPLDAVRDQIERLLAKQMASQAQERWLDRLRREGYVKRF